MTVSLVSLSARNGGEEILVRFEICDGERIQKEEMRISPVDCADLKLSAGTSSPECYDAVLRASQIYLARRRALNVLGYGGCSCRMLVQKLRQKSVERFAAEEAVRRLADEGFLDEAEEARREAERCSAKQWGKQRIVATLRTKGYSSENIRAAMESLEDRGVDDVQRCAERIRRRWGTFPDEPKERQKMVASLQRAGFSFSEIRAAQKFLEENESIKKDLV